MANPLQPFGYSCEGCLCFLSRFWSVSLRISAWFWILEDIYDPPSGFCCETWKHTECGGSEHVGLCPYGRDSWSDQSLLFLSCSFRVLVFLRSSSTAVIIAWFVYRTLQEKGFAVYNFSTGIFRFCHLCYCEAGSLQPRLALHLWSSWGWSWTADPLPSPQSLFT